MELMVRRRGEVARWEVGCGKVEMGKRGVGGGR